MRKFWCVLLAGFAFCASGQEEDKNGAYEFWSRMSIRWVMKDSIQQEVELQFRDQQRVASLQERFHLYTFRWYIQKRWNNFYLQGSPVTFFERQSREGQWTHEFRLTQFAGWFFLQDKLQARVGMEGRFFWTEDDHFEEIRWRSRVLYSISLSKALQIQISEEILFHKRTSGTGVPFIDQNRVSTGIRYKLTKNWSIDSGYQYQVRSFPQDGVNHFNVFYFYVMVQL